MNRAIILGLILSLPFSATAQEVDKFSKQQIRVPRTVPAMLKVAARLYQVRNFKQYTRVMEEVTKLQPDDGDLMLRLAGAYALIDDKTHAFDLLLKMIEWGFSYDISVYADFENLKGYGLYDHIIGKFEANAQPSGLAAKAFEVTAPWLLVDSITFDRKSGDFFVGSVREGKVLRVNKDGESSVFIAGNDENRLRGVFAVTVDNANGWLWLTSNDIPHFKGFDPDSTSEYALLQYDVVTGKLIKRYQLPADGDRHLLGNIAVARNGDLYISDSETPKIYKWTRATGRIGELAQFKELKSIRGIALNKDDSILYLSDYQKGIFLLNLADGRTAKMAFPKKLITLGIDNLVASENGLIVIQSGMSPERVFEITLDKAGTTALSSRSIFSALPQFDGPSSGVVVNNVFYLVANSLWSQYATDGKIIDPSAPKPTVVLKTLL